MRSKSGRLRCEMIRSIGAGGMIPGLRWLSAASKSISSARADCIPVCRMINFSPAKAITVGIPRTPSALTISGRIVRVDLQNIHLTVIFLTGLCWPPVPWLGRGAHHGAQISTIGRSWVFPDAILKFGVFHFEVPRSWKGKGARATAPISFSDQ